MTTQPSGDYIRNTPVLRSFTAAARRETERFDTEFQAWQNDQAPAPDMFARAIELNAHLNAILDLIERGGGK